MEDVFDTTGRPPSGWMHAVFDGGPYADDVGRCVPGPPAPAVLAVALPEGGEHVYRLAAVGSWSDPDHPVAVYGPDAPPAPPPLLTGREKTWIRRQLREGTGPDPVVLVAFDARGTMVKRPSGSAIVRMLSELGPRNAHMVLQRLDDAAEDGEGAGDAYLQAGLGHDHTYHLEYRAGGVTSRRCRTRALSQDQARDALLGWAEGRPDWRSGLDGR
ncbi:hypothetical protein ABZ135_08535 [Streptomyces sp. NPDC006339]|uniref:hypothetical protein n=1 Tax=Streptomyces sp. NPDC006339 TaxID=3156755 RepID=UPI0033BC647C